jgi:hypothetical protein
MRAHRGLLARRARAVAPYHLDLYAPFESTPGYGRIFGPT